MKHRVTPEIAPHVREVRRNHNRPVGWALWLTGLPASGKTTLARTLRRMLAAYEVECVILDSDEVRQVLTPNPTYSSEERDRFYRGLVDLAHLLTDYGVNVIIAATGSWRAYREAARKQLHPFAEVYVRCPIEVCRQRDPKGLYARADAGEITNLPGVGVPYEEPENPAVIVDTDVLTPEEAARRVIAAVPMITRASKRTPLRVAQLMSRDPVTVRPEDPVTTAQQRMTQGGFHHLPVVDVAGRLVGIVSHGDLKAAHRAFATTLEGLPAAETARQPIVADCMTPNPITVEPDTLVVDAVQKMLAYRIGSLPVLKRDELVGILTDRDILRWVAQELS